MFGRYTKPLVLWSLTSVTVLAQQPGRNMQLQPAANRPLPTQNGAATQANSPNPAGGLRAPQAAPPAAQPGNQGNLQAPQQTAMQPNAAQQLAAQQIATNQQAMIARLSKPPFEALTMPQQQYLDQVLDVWEKQTAAINQYECKFARRVYDPGQSAFPDEVSKASGILRYMAPDKGLYRVEQLEFFAGRGEDNKATYRPNEREKFGEYWLCDGSYVHILDRNLKTCTKTELPPNMRGQNIHMSPLPFLFGVKAKEIQSRYWIRPIAPPQGSQDVYLETFPKNIEDAGNYSRVQVVLDRVTVLPKALIVFLPNWQPNQPHQEIYEFTDRKKEWGALDKLQAPFKEQFIPTIPKDWQVIVEPYQPIEETVRPNGPGTLPGANPASQPAVPGTPRVAQPPAAAPRR